MKKTYRVLVPTTNCFKNTFKIHGEYYPCSSDFTGGYVYIITDTPEEIFKQIPIATEVKEVGVAFELSSNEWPLKPLHTEGK